jgi:hypothetical protein
MAGRMKLSNAIRPPAGLTEKFCLNNLPFSPDQSSASPRLKYGRADETEQCHPPAGRAD